MTRNRILMTCAIASLALGLSACSSDDGPMTMMPDAPMVAGMVVPTDTTITLPAGLLDDKAYEAAEGGTVTFDDVGEFKCLSATCTVVVENDVITTTGDIQVVSLVDDLPAEVLTALADVAEDPPAELTPLGVAQEAAQDAADLAGTAATTAEAAATAAKEAAAGRARFQTIVPSSYKHAHSSQTHANLARADADAAQTAATAAADAATLTDAIQAQLMAEELMESAQSHQAIAESSQDDAVEVAATELFVGDADGDPMYRVGTTTIVLDGVKRTRDDAVYGNVGDINEMNHMGSGRTAEVGVADVSPPRIAIPAFTTLTPDIGDMYDSPDDGTRLWLINAYAGTKTVALFTLMGTPLPAGTDSPHTATAIDHDNDDETARLPLTPANGVFLFDSNRVTEADGV